MHLRLENPHMLWALVLVIGLLGLFIYRKLHAPYLYSWWRPIGVCFAFFLMVMGLARPQLGRQIVDSSMAGANLFIAVDTSRSMLAEDVTPSRLEFTALHIRKLLNLIPNLQVSIFPFSSDGYLLSPLTNDGQVIENLLTTLSPSIATHQGTDLSVSLQTLFNSIVKMKKHLTAQGKDWLPTSVLLYSDGESHWELDRALLKSFRSEHIPIFTVGVGTSGGGRIPLFREYSSNTAYLKDRSGNVVYTVLHPKVLKTISDETSGDYYSTEARGLETLSQSLLKHAAIAKTNTTLKIDKEYYSILFFLAFFILLFDFLKGRWEYVLKSLLLLLTFSSGLLQAQEDIRLLKAQIDQVQDPQKRAILAYNLGVQLENRGQMKEAISYYQEASYLSANGALKKKALFNAGNAHLQLGKTAEALEAYQEAFDTPTKDKNFLQASNQRISENMILARKTQEEQQQQKQDSKQNSQDSSQEGNESQDPKGPENDYDKKQFSEARKRRLYELIAMEEQKTLEKLLRKQQQSSNPKPQVKPW